MYARPPPQHPSVEPSPTYAGGPPWKASFSSTFIRQRSTLPVVTQPSSGLSAPWTQIGSVVSIPALARPFDISATVSDILSPTYDGPVRQIDVAFVILLDQVLRVEAFQLGQDELAVLPDQ